jgi:hypothetical protein
VCGQRLGMQLRIRRCGNYGDTGHNTCTCQMVVEISEEEDLYNNNNNNFLTT